MPTIYDNINATLMTGLGAMLEGARRADFCVGYFNLRGWAKLRHYIDTLSGENDQYCRLLVGMTSDPDNTVKHLYGGGIDRMTQSEVAQLQRRMIDNFARQLTYGAPTNSDQDTLRHLAKQLRSGRLKVKLYTRHSLHAKLYLVHRADRIASLTGVVGSSNLTLSGLAQNGELNVDVVEQDATRKLAAWFKQCWDDEWSIDISTQLAAIIEASWANGPVPPYYIYIKTAWHLSRQAISESERFRLPPDLEKDLLEHQRRAVSLAAQRLNHQHGVIIGDVVGLGKTLIATAVAKVFQEDHGHNVLVICPPALEENWKNHLHTYGIAGDTLSLGKVNKLKHQRRYKLIILDESHNLRNRKSSGHQQVRDYIRDNDCRVIMLTATPYNKDYQDIASQLLLFLDGGEDLGIIPEEAIAKSGGLVAFRAKHPKILASSLAAFELSDQVDDWRELMRLFMVRRTRAHIKQHYAKYDSAKERHYLTFTTEERFYFPRREPRRLDFKLTDNDQYARLYSDQVVESIANLKLPRYGLKQYLTADAKQTARGDDMTIIDNLSRAGRRLRGFARTGLFKRLESSGNAFLLSLQRHILRNAMLIAAITKGERLPIGQVSPTVMDDKEEEEEEKDKNQPWSDDNTAATEWEQCLIAGERRLATLNKDRQRDFDWISSAYFDPSLGDDLRLDSEVLLRISALVKPWDHSQDHKLDALRTLCVTTHSNEKILIFTQYKDTVDYLQSHLKDDISGLGFVHSDTKYLQPIINRFSPRANAVEIPAADQLRVLLTTDKLSEGVNLQDAHIVVNYDLPWAIIRLTQRVGRVDRIGQTAATIYCYSAMPAEGIERVIKLRHRLRQRMTDNSELIGSDERFFEGDDEATVRRLHAGEVLLEAEEDDDETDLISRAYDIWQQAIKKDPGLAAIIKNLQDVVYSAKTSRTKGVVAYILDNHQRHFLALINREGELVSRSQHKILKLLRCEAAEKTMPAAENHHALVAKAVDCCRQADSTVGGQLGSENSTRSRVYNRLSNYQREPDSMLFKGSDDLKHAIDRIYHWPLKQHAHKKLQREIKYKIKDDDLATMVLNFWRAGDLCEVPKNTDEKPEPQIICSSGLI